MSIRYKVVKRKFKDKNGVMQEKYYACKKTNSSVPTRDIAKNIQEASSLTQADVIGTIYGLVAEIKRELSLGNSVKIDGLGTFNVSVTSTPMNTPNDLKKATIKACNITFRVDKELKEVLKEVHFEKSKE